MPDESRQPAQWFDCNAHGMFLAHDRRDCPSCLKLGITLTVTTFQKLFPALPRLRYDDNQE